LQSNQINSDTLTDMPNSSESTKQFSDKAEPVADKMPNTPGITSDQAEQIIAQLKSLKQNVFILTLVAGFFALRAILFHR